MPSAQSIFWVIEIRPDSILAHFDQLICRPERHQFLVDVRLLMGQKVQNPDSTFWAILDAIENFTAFGYFGFLGPGNQEPI